MPKITTTKSGKYIFLYVFRIILSTALSLLFLNSIASFLFLKLDLDLSYSKIVGVIILCVTSLIVSLVATIGFKNNYILLSVLSVVPLIVFIFVNFLVNESTSTLFFIKAASIVLVAIITSILKSLKKR